MSWCIKKPRFTKSRWIDAAARSVNLDFRDFAQHGRILTGIYRLASVLKRDVRYPLFPTAEPYIRGYQPFVPAKSAASLLTNVPWLLKKSYSSRSVWAYISICLNQCCCICHAPGGEYPRPLLAQLS